MEFDLNDTVEVLARTPSALRALLDGLPSDWLYRNARIPGVLTMSSAIWSMEKKRTEYLVSRSSWSMEKPECLNL